jgi:hypothetical protein
MLPLMEVKSGKGLVEGWQREQERAVVKKE